MFLGFFDLINFSLPVVFCVLQMVFLYKTIIIIPLTLVGYEMIMANSAGLIGYLWSAIQQVLVEK